VIIRVELLKEILKANLPEDRFLHSIGVMETAKSLSNIYGVDEKKAQIAGLLHDCARGISLELQLKMAEDFGILLEDIERQEKLLIHGPLGAVLAREIYDITDEQILRAIRIHTTGDINMTCLDKIIFMSDLIEPSRSFPGVDELRQKAFKDLDAAVLSAFDSTIMYLIKENSLIHPKTIRSRNFMLLQKESEEIL